MSARSPASNAGRKPKVDPERVLQLLKQDIPLRTIANRLGLCPTTVGWRRDQFIEQGLLPSKVTSGRGKKNG
ncbi:MAG: helix-turn-helix domain-containing protein [Gluconobacter japonicus]|uniref:helix-turn-helix domain-containing protein n=1 Tax=Gluconobacter japonicus TaxID=376620 RepID=UPI0039EC5BF7